MTDHLVIA